MMILLDGDDIKSRSICRANFFRSSMSFTPSRHATIRLSLGFNPRKYPTKDSES